jgi:hypothetical protein
MTFLEYVAIQLFGYPDRVRPDGQAMWRDCPFCGNRHMKFHVRPLTRRYPDERDQKYCCYACVEVSAEGWGDAWDLIERYYPFEGYQENLRLWQQLHADWRAGGKDEDLLAKRAPRCPPRPSQRRDNRYTYGTEKRPGSGPGSQRSSQRSPQQPQRPQRSGPQVWGQADRLTAEEKHTILAAVAIAQRHDCGLSDLACCLLARARRDRDRDHQDESHGRDGATGHELEDFDRDLA